LLGGNVAWAEPAAITQAKTEAELLQARIDDLNNQLEAAVEDYDYAKTKLSQTSAAAKKTQAKLTRAENDLERVRARLTARVVEIYKQGHLGMLDTIAGAASFSDLINRLGLLERVSAQDSKLAQEIDTYRTQVSDRKNELAAQLQEEKTLTADTASARKKVEERLAANEKALAGKEKQIAQLQKAEAARQAKLAAAAREAARKAALAEAARKRALAALRATRLGPSGGSASVNVFVPSTADSSDVVSISMKYLGSPYVWGGSSPSGFDCSGFVLYVYAKVGVSLPHSSRMQYGSGLAESRADLQPGDLVFFGNPIHHVGIYIGGGKMINAAGTGLGVRIDSIDRGNYSGACRIIL
jgi:cell wall-associated NlpC family hydrolase